MCEKVLGQYKVQKKEKNILCILHKSILEKTQILHCLMNVKGCTCTHSLSHVIM